VSGLKIGQINFIRGLIGETLCLGAQFWPNWEDWNFKWIKFYKIKICKNKIE